MHSSSQLFLEINILLLKELLKQWMTASSPVKINTVTLQRMDDCHSFCDKKKYLTSRDGWLQLEWLNKLTTLKKINCLSIGLPKK